MQNELEMIRNKAPSGYQQRETGTGHNELSRQGQTEIPKSLKSIHSRELKKDGQTSQEGGKPIKGR